MELIWSKGLNWVIRLLTMIHDETWVWILVIVVIGLVFLLLYFKSYVHYIMNDDPEHFLNPGKEIKYFLYCSAIVAINCGLFFVMEYGWLNSLNGNALDDGITIITTVLISFFGLTAASYTFQLNDLHGQQRDSPNDYAFIEEYLAMTRFKFTVALWGTVLISAVSIGLYMFEPFILTENIMDELKFILCCLSVETIIWMMYLNWVLFFHERYINKYAENVLRQSGGKGETDSLSVEECLKRINEIDIVVHRLRKNSIHIRETYPLKNRDMIAFLGGRDEMQPDQNEECRECLQNYYTLRLWRNAVVREANSGLKRPGWKTETIFNKEYQNKLERVEGYLKAGRLEGEIFTGMDLARMSIFAGARLEKADFSDSNLEYVDLRGTVCTSGNFSNTRMSQLRYFDDSQSTFDRNIQMTFPDGSTGIKISKETKFDQINCKNSNMEGSMVKRHIEGELFEISDESRENLMFSMESGNFDSGILSGSEFEGVSFEYSSFDDALMYGVKLKKCDFSFSTFIKSVLSTSVWKECIGKRGNFSNAFLVSAQFYDCFMEEARLHRANMGNIIITRGNWSKIMATGSSMKRARFNVPEDKKTGQEDAKLDLSKAVLRDVDFTEAMFFDTIMTGSRINECVFTSVSGQGNNFLYADMQNCIFDDTKISDSLFDYARFDGSSFRNSSFDGGCFRFSSFCDCIFLLYAGGLEEQHSSEWGEWMNERSDEMKRIIKEIQYGIPGELFKDALLYKVNFKGSRGLQSWMFKNAVVTDVDFSNTEVSEDELKKVAKAVSGCIFGNKPDTRRTME